MATALDAFDFLPGGIPVRSEQETVINTWQDDTVFAGKIVPGRVTVAAMTRPLVEATIAIEPLAHADPAAFDLPGGPASPAVTLRPLIGYTRRSGEALNASSVPAASLLDGPVGTGFWIELSGSLWVAQAQLQYKNASGLSIPFGVKWSNKTELLTGNKVGAQIGISYDFSFLSSALNPTTK